MPKTRPGGRASRTPPEILEEEFDENLKRPILDVTPAEPSSAPDTAAHPLQKRTRKKAPAAQVAPRVATPMVVGSHEASADPPSGPGRAGRLMQSVAAAIAAGLHRYSGVLISIVTAALVFLGAVALGPVDGSNAVLVGLGFDPDRAQLITALIVGGATAVAACLVGGIRWAAVPLGFVAMVALFASTFATETQTAMAATGATGSFAPVGWTQTLGAFIVVGVLTAWACATCALPLRREIGSTAAATMAAARERPLQRGSWARPAAVVLVVGLMAVTLPLAGDLFNYGADERMIAGGPPRQGLVPEDQGFAGEPITSLDPGLNAVVDKPSATPSGTAPAGVNPSPGQAASAGAIASGPTASGSPGPTPRRTPSMMPPASNPPWRASPPTGEGQMVYLAFNAPWSSAGDATEEVAVYLPPGYDTNTTKRYPSIYEAPFLFNVWNAAFHVKSTLDGLIDDGQIPPTIVLFMNAGGGPFADTQCADTYDGREKMDRFMGESVPAYIDKHYRTIAQPSARAVMGMSEGGYCAAILALHHPDVFGSAISFSGYFTAGLGSASAPIPFGGNPTLIANDSPTYVAPKLDGEAQLGLYFVIVAQGDQVFYGTQAAAFMDVLDSTAIGYSFVNAEEPHGWPQVRDTFSQALTLVALQQAKWGVFKGT